MASPGSDPSPLSRLPLFEMTLERRAEAMSRFAVLRPHLEDDASLAATAREVGVAPRTAQRWLARYRRDGLIGLVRRERRDAGRPRAPDQVVDLVQGLALRRPRLSAAAIHRKVAATAKDRGWTAPSYATVHTIVRDLDPAMVTLARGTGPPPGATGTS